MTCMRWYVNGFKGPLKMISNLPLILVPVGRPTCCGSDQNTILAVPSTPGIFQRCVQVAIDL